MKRVGELAPTLFADRQCRSGDMAPWANGKNGKEYRSTLGMKAIGGIFNVGIVSPYRWLNGVKSAEETRLWVQDGMANGLRPWFNTVSGSVHDKRGFQGHWKISTSGTSISMSVTSVTRRPSPALVCVLSSRQHSISMLTAETLSGS